jgi:hypothetical protein
MGKLGRLGAQMMMTEAAVKRQGQILPTENTTWGFYGTMDHALGGNANVVWNAMFAALMKAYPGVSSASIREFLDGKYGRHLGDALLDNFIEAMGKAYNPDSEDPIALPEPAKLTRILKATLDKQKWVAKEFSGKTDAAGGSIDDVERAVGRVGTAWNEVKSSDLKKNWKERDAAMHDVQKAADQLLTAARAWMAQRR